MATGTVTQHQNERGDFEAVFPLALVIDSPALSGAATMYVASPVKGNIIGIYAAVNVALTTAKSTLTVKAPDGTVNSSAFEIAHEAAIGDTTDYSVAGGDTLANTEVERGELIEIENDAAPGTGQATYTIVLGP